MNSTQVELRNIYTFFLDDGFVSWQKMLILMYLENFLMKDIPYSSLNLHDLLIILVTIWNIQSKANHTILLNVLLYLYLTSTA